MVQPGHPIPAKRVPLWGPGSLLRPSHVWIHRLLIISLWGRERYQLTDKITAGRPKAVKFNPRLQIKKRKLHTVMQLAKVMVLLSVGAGSSMTLASFEFGPGFKARPSGPRACALSVQVTSCFLFRSQTARFLIRPLQFTSFATSNKSLPSSASKKSSPEKWGQ